MRRADSARRRCPHSWRRDVPRVRSDREFRGECEELVRELLDPVTYRAASRLYGIGFF